MPALDTSATGTPVARPVTDRVPAQGWFVVSAVFHYLGPAFAVLLFARVDVLGVAWLRIATAGLVLALWRRPWRRWGGLDAGTRRLVVTWGAVLAAMNGCFYLAIDRLPLGTVAAVEFVPVLALAALGARTRRNGAALLLAAGGVVLLTEVRLVQDPVGVAFAVVRMSSHRQELLACGICPLLPPVSEPTRKPRRIVTAMFAATATQPTCTSMVTVRRWRNSIEPPSTTP